jgi:hypothetical protein
MSISPMMHTMPPAYAEHYASAAAVYEYRPVIADPHCPCCGAARANCGEHKPLLAERFKTKMCRSYERTGSCPYVHRCMFAHGDHELRTPEMNLVDGLVTEEAIKEFKRVNYEARCFAEYMANVANFELMSARSHAPPCAAPSDSPSSRSSARSDTPRPASASSTASSARRSVFRHDPYAERSQWHPLLGMSTSSLALSDSPALTFTA